MFKKIVFAICALLISHFTLAQSVDTKSLSRWAGTWSAKCGVAGETYTTFEKNDAGGLSFVSTNRDALLSSGKLMSFNESPVKDKKASYSNDELIAVYQLEWDREDAKTKVKQNRTWKVEYLKNNVGAEVYYYAELSIDGKATVKDNKAVDSGTPVPPQVKCTNEQAAKMIEAISPKEAEYKESLQRLAKTPVKLNNLGNESQAFCKMINTPKYDEVEVLKKACDVIISNDKASESDRAAANQILGLGISGYTDNQYPGQPCRDAFGSLQKASEYIEKNRIAMNDVHNRIGYCLVYLDKNDQALPWLDRGNKLKESAYAMFMMGVANQNMKNFSQAKTYYQKALAINPNYDDAKNLLSKIDQAILDNEKQKDANNKRMQEINSPQCQAWRAAIKKNRAGCDKYMSVSLDSFYACMDLGMIRSGYAGRADGKTQQLYQQCGVGSWTESALAP